MHNIMMVHEMLKKCRMRGTNIYRKCS